MFYVYKVYTYNTHIYKSLKRLFCSFPLLLTSHSFLDSLPFAQLILQDILGHC